MEEYTVKVNDFGTKLWYQNDKLHRLDGPAIEQTNGSKFWYQNDKRHRLDGPAIEEANGTMYWYIDGKELTEEEFNNFRGETISDRMKRLEDLYDCLAKLSKWDYKELASAVNDEVDKLPRYGTTD